MTICQSLRFGLLIAAACLPLGAARAEEPKAILKGHTAAVLTVAFSPDGKMLASGSVDRTIRIWAVPSGK
jgi:WD40 repeat protein